MHWLVNRHWREHGEARSDWEAYDVFQQCHQHAQRYLTGYGFQLCIWTYASEPIPGWQKLGELSCEH